MLINITIVVLFIGIVYEHVAEQQTQTQYGSVPRMQLNEDGMKKLESAIMAGSISYDEIFYRYDLTDEQVNRINSFFQ